MEVTKLSEVMELPEMPIYAASAAILSGKHWL